MQSAATRLTPEMLATGSGNFQAQVICVNGNQTRFYK